MQTISVRAPGGVGLFPVGEGVDGLHVACMDDIFDCRIFVSRHCNNFYETHQQEGSGKSGRRVFYYYTEQEWGRAGNYHLTLDSSAFGIEGCVEMILRAAE